MARPRPAAEADGQRRLAVVDGDQSGALGRDGLDVGDLALAEPQQFDAQALDLQLDGTGVGAQAARAQLFVLMLGLGAGELVRALAGGGTGEQQGGEKGDRDGGAHQSR